MVRFCRYCKRALDDIDKFCRECGKDTIDSIDYQTYYQTYYIEKQPEVVIGEVEAGVVVGKVEAEVVVGKVEEKPEVVVGKVEAEVVVEKVEEKPEVVVEKVEEKPEVVIGIIEKQPEVVIGIIEKQPEVVIEKQSEVVVEVEKQSEVVVEKHEDIDMLSQLLPKEEDIKGKDKRYLINKTGRAISPDVNKGGDKGDGDNKGKVIKDVVNKGGMGNDDIVLLSKDSIEKKRIVKRKRYKEYENAIERFIPEILEDIDLAKAGVIRVKVSDITEKMGGKFKEKSLSSIFFGLKYVLYHNGIWIQIGTLNDDSNSKMFIMRRKNSNDKLPPSLIK